MASNKRGRPKTQGLIQKNRLDSYFALKKTKSEGDKVVSDIIAELIISSVKTSGDICANILDELLSRIVESESERTGVKVHKKKIMISNNQKV